MKGIRLENARLHCSVPKLTKEELENTILVAHGRARVKEELEDGTLVLKDVEFTHFTLEEKK